MELINLDAKDMGWTTVKYDEGLAIIFKNERCFLHNFFIT